MVWVRGRVIDNRLHSHHALQIVQAAPGTGITVITEAGELRGHSAVIGGGVSHALSMDDGLVALVDSASALSREIAGQPTGGVAMDGLPAGDATMAGVRAQLASGVPGSVSLVDERVRAVLRWLDEHERAGAWASVSLAGALRVVHLSRSRFLHLFSEQVGSPWRTYLVWRRALLAIERAISSGSLTEAAHAAGYSDSAHLSRQFSALFGITPSAFLKNSHFVQS